MSLTEELVSRFEEAILERHGTLKVQGGSVTVGVAEDERYKRLRTDIIALLEGRSPPSWENLK